MWKQQFLHASLMLFGFWLAPPLHLVQRLLGRSPHNMLLPALQLATWLRLAKSSMPSGAQRGNGPCTALVSLGCEMNAAFCSLSLGTSEPGTGQQA